MSGRSPLFGTEVEYGFTPFDANGRRLDRIVFATALSGAVAKRRPAVPGRIDCDLFLANGSRFYVDCGHPEYATPECATPEDVIASNRAGNRVVEQAAQDVEAQGDVARMLLFRTNTDALDPDVAYGAHENYCHAAPTDIIARNILSHLVTRTIFTGSGGLDITAPAVRFMLSPRARLVSRTTFRQSTSPARGIFHVREEPLATPGTHRLHVVCGDTLCSELGDYLRIGTTALIVALIDAGIQCGLPVTLLDPVSALHKVARDITCAAPIPLVNGVERTAIDVQRHYLECVRDHLGAPFMPDWAPAVCARWADTLDGLAADPLALWPMLDWPLKLRCFRQWSERAGFAWDELQTLPLGPAGRRRRATDPDPLQSSLGLHSPSLVAATGAVPRASQTRHAVLLREQLLEIDVRFGQLGGRGVFAALDAAGELQHRIVDPTRIEHAVTHAPGGTRARQRGRVIRRLAGRAGVSANWTRVVDRQKKRTLILDDPHGRLRPRWEKGTVPPETMEFQL